jgi:hypothetical protein
MRSLKTAVKIWKKELEFKITIWKIQEEERKNFRRQRQKQIKDTKRAMASDLLNRNQIGDIVMDREDLSKVQFLNNLPVFRVVEEIYRKYL